MATTVQPSAWTRLHKRGPRWEEMKTCGESKTLCHLEWRSSRTAGCSLLGRSQILVLARSLPFFLKGVSSWCMFLIYACGSRRAFDRVSLFFAECLLSWYELWCGMQGIQGRFNPLPTFTFLFSSATLTCPLLFSSPPLGFLAVFLSIIGHFFRSYCPKGKAMLQYKETDRPSMMEVLDFEYFKTAAHEPPGKHGQSWIVIHIHGWSSMNG